MSRGVARRPTFLDDEDRRHFLGIVEKLVDRGQDREEQPAIKRLARGTKAKPEQVEAAVKRLFPDVGRARRGRLLLYAQRKHSRLQPVDIARRYKRRHSAVTMAWQAVTTERRQNRDLDQRLTKLTKILSSESDK